MNRRDFIGKLLGAGVAAMVGLFFAPEPQKPRVWQWKSRKVYCQPKYHYATIKLQIRDVPAADAPMGFARALRRECEEMEREVSEAYLKAALG